MVQAALVQRLQRDKQQSETLRVHCCPSYGLCGLPQPRD